MRPKASRVASAWLAVLGVAVALLPTLTPSFDGPAVLTIVLGLAVAAMGLAGARPSAGSRTRREAASLLCLALGLTVAALPVLVVGEPRLGYGQTVAGLLVAAVAAGAARDGRREATGGPAARRSS